MNDMGKEDLLRGLEAFYDWYCEQVSPLVDEPKVYAQLKAIVEQHFDLSYHPSAFGNNKQSPEPGVDEEEEEREQEPMDKETAGDMKFHELKDEDKLDRFGRRK